MVPLYIMPVLQCSQTVLYIVLQNKMFSNSQIYLLFTPIMCRVHVKSFNVLPHASEVGSPTNHPGSRQ